MFGHLRFVRVHLFEPAYFVIISVLTTDFPNSEIYYKPGLTRRCRCWRHQWWLSLCSPSSSHPEQTRWTPACVSTLHWHLASPGNKGNIISYSSPVVKYIEENEHELKLIKRLQCEIHYNICHESYIKYKGVCLTIASSEILQTREHYHGYTSQYMNCNYNYQDILSMRMMSTL